MYEICVICAEYRAYVRNVCILLCIYMLSVEGMNTIYVYNICTARMQCTLMSRCESKWL